MGFCHTRAENFADPLTTCYRPHFDNPWSKAPSLKTEINGFRLNKFVKCSSICALESIKRKYYIYNVFS